MACPPQQTSRLPPPYIQLNAPGGPCQLGHILDALSRKALGHWVKDDINAFDDAALCCSRALGILDALHPASATSNDERGMAKAPKVVTAVAGEGASKERATLLLELAAAQIRIGDLDAGRRNSVDAIALG